MGSNNSREKAVFCEAVDITDPEQRRRFLDTACGADKSLRERVEALLAMSQTAGAFIDDCRPALVATAADADQVLSAAESGLKADPLEARCIGPYKLLQMIGEGGYGVVYMAEQEKPIRRRVALKIIKLGMDTKNVIARFEAERQALALMEHPNIAHVLDAGATETGRPYFVMELVYGVKITEYCDQNRVGMKERLELFIQVCNAVQHAHQKGIIHRDLKPSNIMVTMHDGVPVPKVIDFGIAKATEQRLTDKTLFTSYAQLMGTPAYMSPEQMEFSGLNLDTRSDVYSLGVLLYELLTGRTPFDTAELLKSGVDEMRRTLREREPLSPSGKLKTLTNDELTKTAKLRRIEAPKFFSQLHGDLDWIVLKCLEKDRTRRYEGASALAADIQRYLDGEAILARPPSRWYRLEKSVRKNPMVFLFGATAIVALFLGTIISTIMFVKERAAHASEARLRRVAEVRENASHLALLVSQGRFEEADNLSTNLALDMPSSEVSTGLRALGDWHATHGRWSEAAARFESVLKVNQLDAADVVSEDQLKLAVALLQAGDRRGYEEFRQAEVAGIGPAKITSDYRVFAACLLLPPDTNLIRLFLPWAEAQEKSFPAAGEMRSPHSAEWSKVLALWEYRQGHFSQSLSWGYLNEGNAVDDPARTAVTYLIKAMSGWRLGQFQSARVDWTTACELIHAKSQTGLNIGGTVATMFPGMPQDPQSSWSVWVMADLLRRECDEVIAQSEQSSEATSKSNTLSQEALVILSRELGNWHAIRGEWEQARNHFGRVGYLSALASLELTDEKSFLSLRGESLSQSKGTADPGDAEYVMQTSLLRALDDTSATALEPFAQILERVVASAGPLKEGIYVPASWDLALLGLFEYRRGNYEKALDDCQRSLVTSKYIPMLAATDRVIRAMCFSKLGDNESARSELDGAKSLVRSGLNIGYDSWNWPAWVFVRLLIEEADGLIPQERVSETSSK
jgi:serine/threonine protein kinase/tetratricopeptide (TPR) repeat protein